MINLVLIDDHEMVRQGVRTLLQKRPDFNILDEYGSFEEVIPNLTPEIDIMLIDISLPGMSGLEATEFLSKHKWHIKIIILSSYTDKNYISEFFRSNINGYVVKTSASDHIIAAIDEVNNGNLYCSEEGIDINELSPIREKPKSEVLLTGREIEILEEISRGFSNQEIGKALHIGERTVQVHRSNIISKMGAKNTADLIRKATDLKLI